MVALPLFTDRIDELVAEPKVIGIYPDQIQFAFQTVPPEGVHEHRGKNFTTTVWTKRLIGAEQANEEGWTGKGVTVSVLDTGGTPIHPTTTGLEYHTVMRNKGQVKDKCYDEKTEVLTLDGFKPFSELGYGDKIATLDEKGMVEYHHPVAIQRFHHRGDMVHFEGKLYDLLVTPNHKVLCKHRNSKRFGLREARDLLSHPDYSYEFKANADWRGENHSVVLPRVKGSDLHGTFQPINVDSITPDLWVRFLGWWLTEGSIDTQGGRACRVSIGQYDSKKREEICEIIKRMGFSPYNGLKQVEIHSQQLYLYLKRFGKAKEKFIPKEVKNLPPRLLRELIEVLIQGDGHKNKTYSQFYTQSKRLAEDFQEIAIKAGYASSCFKRIKKGRFPSSSKIYSEEIYEVSLRDRTTTPRFRAPKIVKHDGIVYCVTVPNHLLLVRRNGKAIWSGNSGHGQWVAATAGGKSYFDRTLQLEVDGMAPDSHLIGIKCLGFVIGAGTESDVIAAMELALERRSDIVNLSLGSDTMPDSPEEDAELRVLDILVKHNIIPVIASGNAGPKEGTVGTPGCSPSSVTVGAWDQIKGEVASFSSRGPTNWEDVKPDLVAPGVNIYSASLGMLDMLDQLPNRMAYMSGTSMATPHVAGLLSCARQMFKEQANITLTAEMVKDAMSRFGPNQQKDNSQGWGMITWDILKRYLDEIVV